MNERKLLHEALLEAFDRDDLERMLDHELDIRLDGIAGQGDLSQTMFEVIGYFKRHSQFAQLVQVAYKKRPNNPKLRQLATAYPFDPTSVKMPPMQPTQTNNIRIVEKGGVYVGGSVTGDIITGDGNNKN